MASRELEYLPTISNSILVPVDPADNAIYRRRVQMIKSLITELEDENNLIAYKITKTRRRIAEKRASLEASQALQVPEQRGFWGAGRKSTGVASPVVGGIAQSPAGSTASPTKGARKRDRTKNARAKKEVLTAPTTIAPLSQEELAYLGNGGPPTEYALDSGHVDSAGQSARTADAMEVDELDDY